MLLKYFFLKLIIHVTGCCAVGFHIGAILKRNKAIGKITEKQFHFKQRHIIYFSLNNRLSNTIVMHSFIIKGGYIITNIGFVTDRLRK